MSIILDKYNIDFGFAERNNMPIIICNHIDENELKIKYYEYINIGKKLSKKLIELPVEKRINSIQEELDNLLKKNQNYCLVIDNIDILFNPSYKINILKYFINLSRIKLVFLKWPGKLEDDYLVYSEYNYEDYVKYKIEDYNIICIK